MFETVELVHPLTGNKITYEETTNAYNGIEDFHAFSSSKEPELQIFRPGLDPEEDSYYYCNAEGKIFECDAGKPWREIFYIKGGKEGLIAYCEQELRPTKKPRTAIEEATAASSAAPVKPIQEIQEQNAAATVRAGSPRKGAPTPRKTLPHRRSISGEVTEIDRRILEQTNAYDKLRDGQTVKILGTDVTIKGEFEETDEQDNPNTTVFKEGTAQIGNHRCTYFIQQNGMIYRMFESGPLADQSQALLKAYAGEQLWFISNTQGVLYASDEIGSEWSTCYEHNGKIAFSNRKTSIKDLKTAMEKDMELSYKRPFPASTTVQVTLFSETNASTRMPKFTGSDGAVYFAKDHNPDTVYRISHRSGITVYEQFSPGGEIKGVTKDTLRRPIGMVALAQVESNLQEQHLQQAARKQ